MSAAKRVAHAAETIRARWELRTVDSPQVEAAQALEDTGQLLDPKVAEELERLRKYVVTRQAREEELLATLGRIDLRRSPEAWSLGMTFIAHMDGPFYPCTAGELEPGLRALIEQLSTRIRELEAERHSTNEALDDAVQALRATTAPRSGKCGRELSTGQPCPDHPRHEAQPLMVYRAEHESFVFGLYTTAAAAREHCEAYERRDQPTATFDWIEDEEDGVAELVATVDGSEKPTGYVVTALEVASAYDPDGDE